MSFDTVIDAILTKEGGYVDHRADRGGPTAYGITQAVARANGFTGDMRQMPQDLARLIYLKRYIATPWFDRVHAINEAVGVELIDTGVNMGPAVASTFFQRWLNGFNQQERLYGDLFVDGRIGTVTLEAFRAFLRSRGAEGADVMVAALNCVQGARYLEIAENNPTQESFLYGWIRGRVLQPQP